MRPIATDGSSVVCRSVCLAVTTASPAKTAETMEMPTQRTMYQIGIQVPQRGRGTFEGG